MNVKYLGNIFINQLFIKKINVNLNSIFYYFKPKTMEHL